ncbi:MAG: xanthine dehydrogenase family protein molybdopterin-binding subunit [Anaerolineales bacterium]|nr:xanthine dehydrogenase family protein molybdopterin-binding subunit [Anaerolineales bacterium]
MTSSANDTPLGGNDQRVDAFEKVTGQSRFIGDVDIPGLLSACVLRSPLPHARLKSLNTLTALEQEGVVRVITADDIPGENGFPEYSRMEPVLTPVGDTVKMIGASIALVVAGTKAQAMAGMQAIEMDLEALPVVESMDQALQDDAVQLYETGNVLQVSGIRNGPIETAFEQSDLVVEARYMTSYQEHAALEPEAVLGFIDDEGRVAVSGATHEPHWQRDWIANVLALDADQVRFITPPMGGSFGGKQDPWPLLAVGLIVYLLRKPVRLVFSRGESFVASPKRHPYQLDYRIGADRSGRLTGVEARIRANTGGYDAHGNYLPDYAVMASGGAYRWKAVDIHAKCVFTNGPKSGQFRGFGTPQPTFALECILDEMIQKLEDDPIKFRLRNAIDQSSNSFLGYPSGERLGYAEVLGALKPRYLELHADVMAFNHAQATVSGAYRKGLGVAGMWYRFGKSGSLRIEAHAELGREGHIVLYLAAPDYGQGTSTVMVQLAAETLGLDRDLIELVNADTALTPDSGVQGASRATYWVGNAVCAAVRNLKDQVVGVAAEMVDRDPKDLAFDVRGTVVSNDRYVSVPFSLVAEEFDRLGISRKAAGIFDPSPRFPAETRPDYTPHFVTGAHLAEVLVDLNSGQVRVTRVVAAHDVGRAINRPGAEGQIEGSVLIGVGAAISEEYIPNRTTGLADYILPMIGEMPEIETILVEVPSYEGPFGAKGLGEAAVLPSTPAVINAISRAIGVRVRRIPATPERIFWALRENSPLSANLL